MILLLNIPIVNDLRILREQVWEALHLHEHDISTIGPDPLLIPSQPSK